jgi:hypothetical protein
MAGVKIPLGAAPKSLKARERQDDPPVWIHSQPHAIASAKAQGQFEKPADNACSAVLSTYTTALALYREFGGSGVYYSDAVNAANAVNDSGCGPVDIPGN